MAVSAEVRWFMPDGVPASLASWFESGPMPPGGGRERTDVYLREPNREIGIKTRGGRPDDKKKGAEVKSLVDRTGTIRLGDLEADVEIWTKWTVQTLHLARVRTISIVKNRRLRTFDTSGDVVREISLGADELPLVPGDRPSRGCDVEITAIRIAESGQIWTSLGMEAFGPLATIEASLRRTIAAVAKGFPGLKDARALSYPAWLDTIGLLEERPDPETPDALLETRQDDALVLRPERRKNISDYPPEWREFDAWRGGM
jgi:hypothetical protein